MRPHPAPHARPLNNASGPVERRQTAAVGAKSAAVTAAPVTGPAPVRPAVMEIAAARKPAVTKAAGRPGLYGRIGLASFGRWRTEELAPVRL